MASLFPGGGPGDGGGPGAGERAVGVGSWMVCSAGMLVFNKLAITAFRAPCSLVAMQFLFTALAIVACGWRSIRVGSRADALRWCRVVPLFTGMILTSVLALEGASMTLVITFRALSPVVSLCVESFYPRPLRMSGPMLASLGAMAGGMALYAWALGAGGLGGLAWVALNNLLAVGDRLLQRLMLSPEQDPVDASRSAAALMNNVAGLAPLALAAALTGEYRDVPGALRGLDAAGAAWVGGSCVVGAGISYTGIWAQSLISATSFLVLVNANKFLIVFAEAFLLRTQELAWTQIAGATITIIAGIGYGMARENIERDLEKSKDVSSPPEGESLTSA